MIPFLKLPATSKTDVITLRNVFYKDLLRPFVFAVVLLTLFYGVGALVAEFMFVVNFSNQTYRFDLSGMSSLISTVLLTICVWRLWDYYELRRVYHYDTPQLTRPALGAYITLAIVSMAMLMPWF